MGQLKASERHPLEAGQRVVVYNATLKGPIIEGRAEIVRPVKEVRDQYLVQFDDGDRLLRFVYDGRPQTHPEEYLAEAQRAYRERIGAD